MAGQILTVHQGMKLDRYLVMYYMDCGMRSVVRIMLRIRLISLMISGLVIGILTGRGVIIWCGRRRIVKGMYRGWNRRRFMRGEIVNRCYCNKNYKKHNKNNNNTNTHHHNPHYHNQPPCRPHISRKEQAPATTNSQQSSQQ